MDGAVVGIVATEGPMPLACAGPAPLPATEGPVPLTTAGPVPSSATEDHVPYVAEAYGELPLTPSQEKRLAKKMIRNVNTTPNNINNNNINDAAAAAAAGNDAIRRQNFEWSHGAVHSLLDIYEEKYSALQRGTLRGRHWHEVAQHVSARDNGTRSTKTSKQCKFKIENLKRRYKVLDSSHPPLSSSILLFTVNFMVPRVCWCWLCGWCLWILCVEFRKFALWNWGVEWILDIYMYNYMFLYAAAAHCPNLALCCKELFLYAKSFVWEEHYY